MDWYYAHEGRQNGPVSEGDFPQLVRDGVVKTETLVWHAGMAEWQPYGRTVGMPPLPQTEPQRFCSACGNSFASGDLAYFGESAVCASCKPAWVQRLRQGMTSTTQRTFVYAGFWIRVLAYLIDTIIVGVAQNLLFFPMGLGLFRQPLGAPMAVSILGTTWFLGMAINACYFVLFWTRYGATPGKMVMKLKVVTPEGGLISVGQAFGRYFSMLLSALILCIGYMMAGWDPEKRTLHDRIAGTRVIRAE